MIPIMDGQNKFPGQGFARQPTAWHAARPERRIHSMSEPKPVYWSSDIGHPGHGPDCPLMGTLETRWACKLGIN